MRISPETNFQPIAIRFIQFKIFLIFEKILEYRKLFRQNYSRSQEDLLLSPFRKPSKFFEFLLIFRRFWDIFNLKNLPASRAHSHRALRAQLASLSAPEARDSIVALRAPEFLNVALRARSYALRIHLSLFLIIWYWSSN